MRQIDELDACSLSWSRFKARYGPSISIEMSRDGHTFDVFCDDTKSLVTEALHSGSLFELTRLDVKC